MIKQLFSFKGRISRARMWLIYLSSCLAMSVPTAIGVALLGDALVGNQPPTLMVLAVRSLLGVWLTAVFYVMVAAIVKRLHDRDKGLIWLLFFLCIPLTFFGLAYFTGFPPKDVFPGSIVVQGVLSFLFFLNNLWYLIEVLGMPGTKGRNRFGPDPRAF